MIPSDMLLYIACALAVAALAFAAITNMTVRKHIDYTPGRGPNSSSQLNGDISTLKRELAALTESVNRFRSQSLAGITDTMSEKEISIRENVRQELHKEIEAVTDEFDKAITAIVEKIEQKQEELAVRFDNFTLSQSQTPSAGGDDTTIASVSSDELKAELSAVAAAGAQMQAQASERDRAIDAKMNALISASVIDRFLASLDNESDKRKCLLASLDSVHDTTTLGKLAVAYPSLNSYLILKDLADRGIVSEIAGWALIAGAELTASKGAEHLALAEDLYQGARLSFAANSNNREGLYVIATSLSRLLAGSGRTALLELLKEEAASHLRVLNETKPSGMALPAVQLAEFYLSEGRNDSASILFKQVIELAGEVFPDSVYKGESAGRLWQGLSHGLASLLAASGSERDNLLIFPRETVRFLEKALRADMPLADADKQALQLALLRLCERERKIESALQVSKKLLDDGVRLTVDSENRERFNFIAGEILAAIDELHLSKHKDGTPLLKRLVGIFMAVGNHNKAASAGAKLVDASLDLYGDASLETVVPINVLADVYKAMARYDLAEECYRQILEIQYKVYPSEHEEMVDVLLNLAQVCKLQKDVGEAEIFLESAVEMCQTVFDDSVSGFDDSARKALLARAEALKGQLALA